MWKMKIFEENTRETFKKIAENLCENVRGCRKTFQKIWDIREWYLREMIRNIRNVWGEFERNSKVMLGKELG